MYTFRMRRIQIYIEEQLDERLGTEAARSGTSKAALIREAVALRYGDSASHADPLDRLVASLDVEPEKVDKVVYGPDRGEAAAIPRRRPRRKR
jgi:hypothetical protein